jgi:tetratricopeptide (TPR) repeat protein
MVDMDLSVAGFNHWRYDRTAAMTLVDLCHGGALYYYESPYSCTVWVFASEDALLASYYFKGNTPEGVRAEVKRLLDALRGGDQSAFTGLYPNFAGLCKPGDEAVRLACFHLGDWWGLSRRELPPRWNQLPGGWPESERGRIEQLIDERVKIAQASSRLEEIYPIGRALAALDMFARAAAVFRRVLALEERAGNGSEAAAATQSLGALAAHQQHYDEAAELLRKAVQMWTAASGADDPRVASARATLERVLARK